MKQILKYGKYNVIKCPTCECEYSFDQTDIKDGKVECPCCKEQNSAPVQPKKK